MDTSLHPACEALPELSPVRYRELVESIRQHGLEDPIVLHDGAVLDGRHRLRACAEVGIAPRFVEWDGRGGDPVGFIALKQIRRDMTDHQRAAWATLYVLPVEREKARERMTAGVKADPGEDVPQGNGRGPRARDATAAAVGVNPKMIDAAAKLAERHEPLLRQVEAGTLTLPEAGRRAAIADTVAALPADERERATEITGRLVSQGVSSPLVAGLAGRLVAMPTEERLRVYALSESGDAREQSLALTELAGTPAMPHPALGLLAQAGDMLSRALRHLDGEAAAGDVRRAREIVRDVSRSLQEDQ